MVSSIRERVLFRAFAHLCERFHAHVWFLVPASNARAPQEISRRKDVGFNARAIQRKEIRITVLRLDDPQITYALGLVTVRTLECALSEEPFYSCLCWNRVERGV